MRRVHRELVISQADARFLIGTKGATKRKLMRVSRAKFEIVPLDGDAEENQTVTISGKFGGGGGESQAIRRVGVATARRED